MAKKILVVGVYRIACVINDRAYFGGSSDISKRWIQHSSNLKHGRHTNKLFQSDWDKYGKENFIFEILEECNKEGLIIREQWYLDNVVDWGFDYNIAIDAKSGMKGRFHTQESLDKLSKATTGEKNPMWGRKGILSPLWGKTHSQERVENRSGKNHWNWGNTWSDEVKEKNAASQRGNKSHNWKKNFSKETRKKMSEASQGEKSSSAKLKDKDILEIRKMYKTGNYTLKEVGDIFNVSFPTISLIVNRKTWKHIK